MNDLAALLGIEHDDPEVRRAIALAEGDHHFLRALVQARKNLGLTQAQVADRLGISQASIAAFERYDNDPKLSTIRRYAQVVGLLIAHHVEPDTGQLEEHTEGSAWSPGWQSAGSAQLTPDVTTAARQAEQFLVAASSARTHFALAS